LISWLVPILFHPVILSKDPPFFCPVSHEAAVRLDAIALKETAKTAF